MNDQLLIVVAKFAAVVALVDAFVEILKPFYVWLEQILDSREIPLEIDIVVAAIVSVVFAFGAKLNIFEVAGVPFEWVNVAYVITGLLLSKGSNGFHDLLEKLLDLVSSKLNK